MSQRKIKLKMRVKMFKKNPLSACCEGIPISPAMFYRSLLLSLPWWLDSFTTIGDLQREKATMYESP